MPRLSDHIVNQQSKVCVFHIPRVSYFIRQPAADQLIIQWRRAFFTYHLCTTHATFSHFGKKGKIKCLITQMILAENTTLCIFVCKLQ
jgi:hypothetical protein